MQKLYKSYREESSYVDNDEKQYSVMEIKTISNTRGWNGFFQDRLPWQSQYRFKPVGQPDFPLRLLFEYDKKKATRFSFQSDVHFTNPILRSIERDDRNLSKKVNRYFWDRIHQNIQSNYVLLSHLDGSENIIVCIVFLLYFYYIYITKLHRD